MGELSNVESWSMRVFSTVDRRTRRRKRTGSYRRLGSYLRLRSVRLLGSNRRTSEAGRIVTMVPLASLAAIICVGIGVDFSGQTMAEQVLRDQVAGCARSSADWASVIAFPGLAAVASANQCLSDLGLSGTVAYADDVLTVTSNGVYQTKMLSIVGVSTLATTATATSGVALGR